MTADQREDRVHGQRVSHELTRIRRGIERLTVAGSVDVIAKSVESQMDEDERRRFPDFYHWRRECAADAGAWKPPVGTVELTSWLTQRD